MNRIRILGLLIVLSFISCSQNTKEQNPEQINCIQDFKFEAHNYPSPVTMIAKLKIGDTELQELIKEYSQSKPVVRFAGNIFRDSTFSYKILRITFDSLNQFTLGSWVMGNSTKIEESYSNLDSLSAIEFPNMSILISIHGRKWVLDPCRNK